MNDAEDLLAAIDGPGMQLVIQSTNKLENSDALTSSRDTLWYYFTINASFTTSQTMV